MCCPSRSKQTQRVVSKLEEAVGFKELYAWTDHQNLEVGTRLAQLRSSFAIFTDEEWQQAVLVHDQKGGVIDIRKPLQVSQFPLSIQLPKQAQMVASLTQQQALLTRQQASLIESQPQMLDRCRDQFTLDVKKMQEDTNEFIAQHTENMMARIRDELEADRKIRDANHKKMMEGMETFNKIQLEQTMGTAKVSKDIQSRCQTIANLMEEIPATLDGLTKVEKKMLPDLTKRIQTMGNSIQAISTGLEVVPNILQELSISHENIKRIETNLDCLPKVVIETHTTCDSVHRMVEELKHVPVMLQVNQSACEHIHRMGVNLQPVLGVLQETKTTCAIIREDLSNLLSMPAVCKDINTACEDIQKLRSDLMPLHASLDVAASTCARIEECVVETLPSAMTTMHRESTQERRVHHQIVIDGVAAVSRAVAKAQPLTLDQYNHLTNSLNQVLSEMQNPIPQPKMSFANAVVHVHKGKKCDDVILTQFSSPKGRPSSLSHRSVLTSPQSAEIDAVEVPLSNLTGKLNSKKGESPSRKTTPSPALRKHGLSDACQRNDPGGTPDFSHL